MNANEGHFRNSVTASINKAVFKVFQPKLNYVVDMVMTNSEGLTLEREEVTACCKTSIEQIMNNLDLLLFNSVDMSAPHDERTFFIFPKVLEIVKAFNPHIAYYTARKTRITADLDEACDFVDNFFDALRKMPKSDVAYYWFDNKEFYTKHKRKLTRNSFFELNSYVFGYFLHWSMWDDQRFNFAQAKEPELGRKALYVTNEASHPAFNECLAFSYSAAFTAKFLNQRQAGELKSMVDNMLDKFVKMAISPEAKQLRKVRQASFQSKVSMPYSSSITPALVEKVVKHKVKLGVAY